jgi:signal transduction histidine kinase
MSGDLRGNWDARRVQQALRNLVVNALRHGAADGPVGVSLRGEDAQVTLEVANSGPPLRPAALSQLFQPLKRVRAQDDREGREGLGLGLYIVREIARAHGGEVDVRSGGEETVFTVYLPRK